MACASSRHARHQKSDFLSVVGNWPGKFIWLKGESHPYHRYLFARLSLLLEDVPSQAALCITAVRPHHLFAGCAKLLVGDPDPGGPERLYASVKSTP